MRTEKVTAIRKQSFENFPLCISRQIITELFPLLKDAPEDSCNSHNLCYATTPLVSLSCLGELAKNQKIKTPWKQRLDEFYRLCEKVGEKKNKTSMFKPVLSGAVEVYKPVNVGWLRLLENSFVYYCITAKGKNSAVGGFSYTEFSCNPSPTVFPIYSTQFLTV